MKLRNFKKAIHRFKDYKYHEPRINEKIFIRVNGTTIYYTCHKLSVKREMGTTKYEYVIRKRGGER